MNILFHPKAVEELNEAVHYYEQSRTGLGLEFAEEMYATIARIVEYPHAWTALSSNTRRCLANRFPFGIIFHSTPQHAGHDLYHSHCQSAQASRILDTTDVNSILPPA